MRAHDNINHSDLQKKTSMSLTVRSRIFLGFFAMTAILIIAVAFVLIKVTVVKDFSTKITQEEIPSFSAYIDISSKLNQSESVLYTWLLTHDAKYKVQRQAIWDSLNKNIQSINNYIIKKNDSSELAQWQTATALLNNLKIAQDNTENAQSTESIVNNTALINSDILPTLNKVLAYFYGTIDANNIQQDGYFAKHFKRLENRSNSVLIDMRLVEVTLYALIAIVIIAAFFIANYTTKAINNYINVFRQHSYKIASGDLTDRLTVNTNDEMAKLGDDLNKMTDSLATVASQINTSCHDMISTLEEVRHASDVQATGSTEQASSINEITSSLEEIEKSSIQTIEKAKALGEVAEKTRTKGQQGLTAVEQSTIGMKNVKDKVQTIAKTILELSKQTQQVGEITAVVNTLAQQSKMLALNASIEAAKAGEAGKGFAVVAAEVKNLAEQSEHSTAQVQKILEDIRHATEKAVMATEEGIKEVDNGTSLVEETGDIVRNLSDVIHETTIASQQIEAAIRQEGIGIEQITSAMNEINQVTYSYVESVKQTIEAISNLSQNVKNLKEYIDIYKI